MNPILARFQDEPALIGVSSRAWFESCVSRADAAMTELGAKLTENASDDFWFEADDWRAKYRPYSVKNGILSVPVNGVLLNHFPWSLGYATGYEYIWQAVKRGAEDSEVKGIALVIDSPGGMVAGNFDLCERIAALRSVKPIRAFAAENAYSAAYSIASSAEHITVTRTGGVGSIGVVVMHVDYSSMLDSAGIKVTFIYAGKHKVDGNPYEPLPKAVRERIQERIDATYDQFVAIIAANRSMDEKAIRETEAATFMASEAIANGLADKIGALDDALSAFEAIVINKEDEEMAANTQADTQLAEAHAAAVETARIEGHTKGLTEGRDAAMTRINGIIGSDVAKSRPKAALNAALKTSMSVEEATAFLAELPEESAQKPEPAAPQGAGAPTGMLEAAMNGTSNPNLGAGNATADEENTPEAQAEKDRALAAAYGLAGFEQPKK